MRGLGETERHRGRIAATPLVLLGLAAVAFSGCLDGAGPAGGAIADGGDTASPYIPIAVAPDEAAIDGLVLDDDFRPLAEAAVELRGAARVTHSDAEGRFAFLGLEPGAYTVTARRDGHHDALTTIELAAGQVGVVQLFLSRVGSTGPYYVPLQPLQGFVACSVGVNPVQTGAPCANDPNQRLRFTVPHDAALTGLVFEMTWQPRGEFAGKRLEVLFLEPASAAFARAGEGPLVHRAASTNESFADAPGNVTFEVRAAAGTTPLQGGDWSDSGGVVWQQPFTVHLTLFHRGHAVPASYTAIPDA